MKGISVATLILCFVITGTSAQYCGECYQTCLDIYDWIGNFTTPWTTPFAEYAYYLRYVKSLRERNNARGTAYAMDQTVSNSFEWDMQKNVAYATAIINPADTECNPFFLTKYRQLKPGTGGVCASAAGSWQCLNTCDAANTIDSLSFIEPEQITWPDYLYCGCINDHHIAQVPNGFASCEPQPISRNEMFIAFYNSNDQLLSAPHCSSFPTRVGTKINGPGSLAPSFIDCDLDWSHFWPAFWMKRCLNYFCECDTPGVRSLQMESDRSDNRFIATNDDGESTMTEARTEEEFAELFGGVQSGRIPDDEEIKEKLDVYKERQNRALKMAIKNAGVNFKGWNPLEGQDDVKPVRQQKRYGGGIH